MSYSIQHITSILSAHAILAEPGSLIEELVTDSRRIAFPATSLFFAIQTERRDGHTFIKEVYERGVRNFIVKDGFVTNDFTAANFVFVKDTLEALQNIAAFHRLQFSYPVIGITGSNGKTIVKEWLYQLLSPDHRIIRSPRSYNSQIGVPLSVWQMSAAYDLAIFEAGISMPGEMSALEKIIQPTIGVFTNIGEAHSENFENTLTKAAEKIKLFSHAAVLVCNADDAIIQQSIPQNSTYEFFCFGMNNAAIEIRSIQKESETTSIAISFHDTDFEYVIPFIDDASIQNSLTCLSVLLYLNVSVEKIIARMKALQPVDMRLQLIHGINNCAIINDSYSFDINSFSIALDFLVQQQTFASKTVIVSDIPSSVNSEAYEAVTDMLHAKSIQRVITIGEHWKDFQHLLVNRFPVTQHYQNTENFLDNFTTNHFRDEAILLKGARVFEFEKIVAVLEKKVHQTVMEINLTAIAHNLNQYKSNLGKGVKIMAMVKAFAYGSGSTEVASLLQFHKIDYLGVAYADEAVELRKAGISLPIMVMNVDEAAFETIIQYNLEPELFSEKILRSFISFLQKQGLQQYPVHIKLDTGMHRLGFEQTDLPVLLGLLQNNHNIVVRSAFSHLVASEDANEDAFTLQQSAIFEDCCTQLQSTLGYNFIKHISNSAAIFRLPQLQYDMVRLGIGLYGVDSSKEFQSTLQTVATLKTTIAQLRKVKAGDTVGYNRRGKLLRDSLIATIRIGYADGFSRKLGYGNGKVFINGMYAPVIGSVAMDMAMVDVTDVPNIDEESEVEIFGKNISVQQVAEQCGTIAYEILATINQRVKRIYVEE